MADYRSSQQTGPPLVGSTGRQSQPGVWTPYAEGGIGIIPRRNLAAPNFLRTRNALAGLAFSNPLRLLLALIDSDPDCSLALDNIITLTTGDVQIVAQPPGIPNAAPDALGTAKIAELLDALPPEIGGLEGLQSIGTIMGVCTGLSALEAVPGELLTGVRRIWPVDSLTLMSVRENNDADAVLYQRQNRIDPALSDPVYPGFARMNPERFFWKPYQPDVDNPYGRVMFGPALAEILSMLHVLQSVRDCIDHTAWPRGVVEIDTTALYDLAKKQGFVDSDANPAASEWVLAQYQQAVQMVQTMKADDWMVLGGNGRAVMMQGGSFAGLEGMLAELRSRIVRGLKQLPVMMAFQEGSTEGHTTVQWQVYARRLEAVRSAILAPILKALSLHLRLLGLNLHAVAKYQPIRTTDALVEATTEAQRIKNAATKVLLGWITNEQAAIEITGSGPAKDKDGDADMLRLVVAGKGNSPTSGNGSGGPERAGGTQEEQDAQNGQGNGDAA